VEAASAMDVPQKVPVIPMLSNSAANTQAIPFFINVLLQSGMKIKLFLLG
jgi:hypothetical protein